MITYRENLAWAAGIVDGEGSFVYREANHTITLSVWQVHPEMLERMQEYLGVGKVRGPYDRSPNKPSWSWQASSFEGVQHALAQMWPWLGSGQAGTRLKSLGWLAGSHPPRKAKTTCAFSCLIPNPPT